MKISPQKSEVGLMTFRTGFDRKQNEVRFHGPNVHPPDDMSLESDGGMILTEDNRRTRRKTYPSATFSTTNPTCTDPGANPGLRGERPATNHGYGIAVCTLGMV
jgi:hypothetical protein